MKISDVNLTECEACGYVSKLYTFDIDERFEYLKESIRSMANAIDNETPDLALWEIRRVVAAIEAWDDL